MQNIRVFGAGLAFVVCLILGMVPAHADFDFMPTGVSTTAPIGHHLFCIETPRECAAEGPMAQERTELEPELIRKIAEINTRTNAEIEPVSDFLLFGVEERWTFPAGRGDCEDFVLLKRRQLHAIGIPLSNLLITVVNKANGEGHAVLTLRTTIGDFVLDNLDWQVKPWRDTPYRFVKRQSETDPRRWLAIAPDTDVVVGALGK